MANKIIKMSVLRQIITLKNNGLSNRAISGQLGLSRKTTNKYIGFVQQNDLSPQSLLELSDAELSALVRPAASESLTDHHQLLYSYFPVVEKELKRVGVTRYVLWQE